MKVWSAGLRLALALVVSLVPAASGAPPPNPPTSRIPSVGALAAAPDFNADGFHDLAIGAPLEDIGSAPDAGVVHVLYGSSGGLSTAGAQVWGQHTPGIADDAEMSDSFGAHLAYGDFNGDGLSDLAISAHAEDIGTAGGAGAVHVLYGSVAGLTATGSQFWHQDSPGVEDAAEGLDLFGLTLAVGDFNDDGFADLAVGVPNETVGSSEGAGGVHVFYGSPAGLTSLNDQLWTQDSPGIADTAESADVLGDPLIVADFNSDGFPDLAAGVHFESVGSAFLAGAVHVFYGSAAGLSAAGNQFLHQDAPGVEDIAESFDVFGSALTSGDFNGDGFADLGVGVPGEDVGSADQAGAAHVFFGSATGLNGATDQFLTQDFPDAEDMAEPSDAFGVAVNAADFNGDGLDDLVVVSVEESVNGNAGAGAVQVFYGTPAGLTGANDQFWTQDSPGVQDSTEPFDRFGSGTKAADFDGDGFTDLAVGVFREDVGGFVDAGAIQVFYGSPMGLTATRNQFWTQDSPGVEDAAEFADLYGHVLAAADFNGDGFAELVSGIPSEDVARGTRAKQVKDAGAVHTLRGSSSGLTAAGDQLWTQDNIVPRAERAEPDDGLGFELTSK